VQIGSDLISEVYLLKDTTVIKCRGHCWPCVKGIIEESGI